MMPTNPPAVICVCPVKDEAYQLDRFLASASMWSTHVILADQRSSDNTLEVARRYPKVRVIENPDATFDERSRQQLLLSAAREIPGPRVIIALDADELLTANVIGADEWRTALQAKPGTALYFDWVNLRPGAERAWIRNTGLPWGYVDDGRAHAGTAIHSPRVPFAQDGPQLHLTTIKVLHYQYTDWVLMKRKQMFYQCWETVHTQGVRAGDLYRKYHHMDAIDEPNLVEVREEWFTAYEAGEINVRSAFPRKTDKWDLRILDLLLDYGSRRFAKLDIWSVDWGARLRELRPEIASRAGELNDPRNPADRAMLMALAWAQTRAAFSLAPAFVRRLTNLAGW